MIFLFVPETKRRTLEELDKDCKPSLSDYRTLESCAAETRSKLTLFHTVAVSTGMFMRFRVTDTLPYYMKRAFCFGNASKTKLHDWLENKMPPTPNGDGIDLRDMPANGNNGVLASRL
jgi:hypothetical protein